MNKLLLLLIFLLPIQGLAVEITPRPMEINQQRGVLILSSMPLIKLNMPNKQKAKFNHIINRELRPLFRNLQKENQGSIQISFSIEDSIPGINSLEGYSLSVSPKGVMVEALDEAGLFYAVQTLKQMITDNKLQYVEITDQPRFNYRGLMLDISRHFRDKGFILKQIDAMAALKLNRLHLHLTDAAGWRLEIKKYPRLTNYAAWRPEKTWKDWQSNGMNYANHNDNKAFGGYLTQKDAKEIVEYAAERHITVIPEIEMPSHSEEVTAAFPEISCTHNPHGEPDVCIGNEKTFKFYQDVLDEVMSIFPSHYIHIGGDEASKKAWKDCELCKKRMEEYNLKDVDALQSYMISRIEKYLNSKGRSIIGWDEIMEGGLAPNATVMSWRGIDGGLRAAQSGHKAIMSPGGYCYLDSYQDAPHTQPEAIGGYLTLEKVYSYNPIPDSLANQITPYIDGVQGNLWCEYIPTAEHAEYMIWPREIAIAEIGWTPQNKRDWNDFHSRILTINDRMRQAGYNNFDIRNEIGSRPQSRSLEKHLAFGKPVKYNQHWWKQYTAGGDSTLVDGLRGDWNYSDGRWQGFLKKGDYYIDVTIDLEHSQPIKYIGGEFMQITGPGVWFPEKVIISISENGEDFTTLKEINHIQVDGPGTNFKLYDWSGNAKARYIRYQSTANNGCQFLDEIIVK